MIPMNNLKSKAGFTLVELIVVIAILAILAGVGTAAYTGYIKEANESADISACDAVKTAVFAAHASNSKNPPACIVVTYASATTATVTVGADEGTAAAMEDSVLSDFYLFLNGNSSTTTVSVGFKSGTTGTKAVWTNNAWTLTPTG